MTVGGESGRDGDVVASRQTSAAAWGSASLGDVDPEALLVALTLVPTSYARNRFEPMYRREALRRVRRRASMVRSIIRDLLWGVARYRARVVAVTQASADALWLEYRVPEIDLRRTCMLTPLELTLIRFALRRALDAPGKPATRLRPAADLSGLYDVDQCPAEEDLGRITARLLGGE